MLWRTFWEKNAFSGLQVWPVKNPVHIAFWLDFKAYWLDQILVLHQLIYAKHKSGSSPLLPILRCWQPKYLKRPNRGKEKGGGRLSPFITPTSGLILYSIASPCSTILSLQLYFEKRTRSLHKYCTVLSKFEWTLCFQILRVAMGRPTMVSSQIFLYPNILKFFPNNHGTSKYPYKPVIFHPALANYLQQQKRAQASAYEK